MVLLIVWGQPPHHIAVSRGHATMTMNTADFRSCVERWRERERASRWSVVARVCVGTEPEKGGLKSFGTVLRIYSDLFSVSEHGISSPSAELSAHTVSHMRARAPCAEWSAFGDESVECLLFEWHDGSCSSRQ